MTNKLKRNAVFGISWTTAEYIFIAGSQVVQLSVLARILTPVDFGIVAIGTFFTTLGNTVFALGLAPALVQKEGEIKDYLDTAWSANLLISLVASVLLLAISPVIVKLFFNEPDALLPTLALISVVAISGLNNIGIVLFMKKIEMKRIFFYHVLPKIIGVIVAIIVSFMLKNYWGLVVGIIVEYISRVILSYLLIPRKPSLKIERKKLAELYSFGGWLQLKNIVGWASHNVDVAIVGSVVSTAMLGFYNRATSLAKLPESQINKIINVISFPLFASLKGNDDQLYKAVKYNNDFVLLLLGPVLLITQLYSVELVNLLLGDGWQQLAPAFKYLVIALSIKAYVFSFTPLLRALGLSKFEFYFNTLNIAAMILLLLPLTKMFGIEGAAIAILLSALFSAPLMMIKISRSARLNLFKLSKSLLITLAIYILIYLVHYLMVVGPLSNIELIIYIIITLMVYLLLLGLAHCFITEGPFEALLKAFKIIKSK
jgi:O-antigen/teichoic acid export membrane protein